MLLQKIQDAYAAGKIDIQPFFYQAEFPIAALLAGATVIQPINTQNDSDFVTRYVNLSSYSAAGTLTANPDMLISFFDSGSGKNWQDLPQHQNNVCGNGQLPFVWPEPFIIKGSSVIQVTLTNREPAAQLANVSLCGFKIFYLDNQYARF
ncbi:hypothetical protein M0R72_17405 [Candidatus Pacearchaeota archaeon]|jgi:hypothetical protein|nr:hypothetical protein [Candidatus Pacearchaeota archaeon]